MIMNLSTMNIVCYTQYQFYIVNKKPFSSEDDELNLLLLKWNFGKKFKQY